MKQKCWQSNKAFVITAILTLAMLAGGCVLYTVNPDVPDRYKPLVKAIIADAKVAFATGDARISSGFVAYVVKDDLLAFVVIAPTGFNRERPIDYITSSLRECYLDKLASIAIARLSETSVAPANVGIAVDYTTSVTGYAQKDKLQYDIETHKQSVKQVIERVPIDIWKHRYCAVIRKIDGTYQVAEYGLVDL